MHIFILLCEIINSDLEQRNAAGHSVFVRAPANFYATMRGLISYPLI